MSVRKPDVRFSAFSKSVRLPNMSCPVFEIQTLNVRFIHFTVSGYRTFGSKPKKRTKPVWNRFNVWNPDYFVWISDVRDLKPNVWNPDVRLMNRTFKIRTFGNRTDFSDIHCKYDIYTYIQSCAEYWTSIRIYSHAPNTGHPVWQIRQNFVRLANIQLSDRPQKTSLDRLKKIMTLKWQNNKA